METYVLNWIKVETLFEVTATEAFSLYTKWSAENQFKSVNNIIAFGRMMGALHRKGKIDRRIINGRNLYSNY